MAATFQATTRIPCRPLSYENVSLAVNKELIVDYTNGNLYVKDDKGEVHDISQQVADAIVKSGEIAKHLNVTYVGFDGHEKTVTIEAAVVDLVNKIKEHQKVIDELTSGSSEEGGPTIIIKPTQIVEDSNHKFVTEVQINEIKDKVSIEEVKFTLPNASWIGSAAPYTQAVSCEGAKIVMIKPTIDIDHSEESHEQAMKTEEAWASIYRAVTGEGIITFYASNKPKVDIKVTAQLKLTGLTTK